MSDFDPINLGKYIPRGMLEIDDLHGSIVDGFSLMRTRITDELCSIKNRIKFGVECDKVLVDFTARLPSHKVLQMLCWEHLRHELVTEYIKAYVVEISGAVSAIESAFWVTDFAKVAFSTGELPSTPSYPHGGVIVVNYGDSLKLFRKYYEYFMNEYWSEDDKYLCPVGGVRYDVPGPRNNIPGLDSLSPDRASTPKRGGRPASYDGEEFLIQAFIILQDKKAPPSSQAELARRAVEAYERSGAPGGRPSMPWAKTRIRSLWAVLMTDING